MNPERFSKRLARPLALATLPLLAACGSKEFSHISPTETAVVATNAAPKESLNKIDETISSATVTPTATSIATSEQNVNEASKAPSREEVITMAHALNMGAVFVSVRWQETTSVSLKFSRLDVDPDKKNGDDEALIILNKNIPNKDGIARAAFFATSCEGLYRIDLSPDEGKTSFHFYLRLDPQTCTKDFDLSLDRRGLLS